jgi:hypothetical protein
LLVAGCWLLVAGCWLLDAGYWLSAHSRSRNQQRATRNKKPRHKTGLKGVKVISSFGDFGGLQSLWAALDFELHALALGKSAEAFALNGFEVYEHVIAAFTLDEAVTFGLIEPFDCAGFHYLDRPFIV